MPVEPLTSNLERPSRICDQVGPSYDDLRPGKPSTSATFPVYPDLVETLTKDGLRHPDPMVAQVLSTAAGYAYSDVGTVAMMMTRLGLERSLCREISRSVDAMLIRSTAHVVQSHDGRVVIVAFRGTPPLDLISWFLDADTAPERMASVVADGGDRRPFEVHAGFYRNVRITRSEIVLALQRALRGEPIVDPPRDGSFHHLASADAVREAGRMLAPMEALYVTGHSLGGAMAVLLTTMLLTGENPDYQAIARRLRAVYTFGQPMVGSPVFADTAGAAFREAGVPLLRYAYRKDPVPVLPPRSVGEFAHLGQEYRLHRDGSWVEVEPSRAMPWVAGVVNSFVSLGVTKFLPLRDLPFRYKIEDHFPHHYISALVPEGRPDEFGDYFPARG